ncbi:MAG TPA: lasso peptide biosynthesis B2 protein [Candidatus Saccharimonadales bacterium]|jgi:hypothetical protein|nr:lasso peptide biosynthesis B2 protein [Candidatus Saccharimonadales bacterium]
MRESGTLRAFLKLNGKERVIVLASAAALLCTWTGLRIFGFSGWKNTMLRLSRENSGGVRMSLDKTKALASLTTATARRFFFSTSCLEQSLVIWFLLRRRGAPAVLRFGGRKEGGRFEAHAWVESEGVVLNDDGAVRQNFVPFSPLEEPPVALEKYTH